MTSSCLHDASSDTAAVLLRFPVQKCVHRHPRRIHQNIDAIQNRSGNAALIVHDVRLRTAAAAVRIIAAGTGIGRTDQHEPRREIIAPGAARNDNVLILQRLTEKIQTFLSEFRQFVQKKNAAMCKRNDARCRMQTAAHQGLLCNGMMGCQKGTRPDKGILCRKLSRDAVDGRNLQLLLQRKRRKNSGKALCHYRLSGARRPHHEDIMKARCRNLQCALDALLSADVPEIHFRLLQLSVCLIEIGRLRWEFPLPFRARQPEKAYGLRQTPDADAADPMPRGRFPCILLRQQNRVKAFLCRLPDHRKDAADRRHLAVQ